ncbi:MAG: N-acetylmuramoyl-L-alanine amidase [Atopobiaceae bacterium]|nr:N-acetylmuramoyl-L-alanine amidase [Atopobiaceae bacterium]
MEAWRKTGMSFLLAVLLTLGLVPAPAIAEALDEVRAVQAEQLQLESLTSAVETAALQISGDSQTEKIPSLYALLAEVPITDAHMDEVDGTIAALHGEPTTAAHVAHAFTLAATEVGISAVEVNGSDGSSWCMVETQDGWRHVNPAAATSAEDASWLLLTDAQLLEMNPSLASWTLADGSEAPKAEELAEEPAEKTAEELAEEALDDAPEELEANEAATEEEKDEEESAEEAEATEQSQEEAANEEEAATEREKTAPAHEQTKRTASNARGNVAAQADDASTQKSDISKATVSIADQGYTGEALKPAPTVKLSGKELQQGTDYDVKYANNTRVGNAQVTILGKGTYEGEKQASFRIVAPSVSYHVHVQTIGTQDTKKDGETAGTSGMSKRLEAIWIDLASDFPVSGGIEYATHVQYDGWQTWAKQGAMSGTEGQSKRLEAIRIKLTGDMAKTYSVYYRVHAQRVGWMAWAKDGETAGTSGLSWRLEAIQIKIVPKKASAPSSEGSATSLTHLSNPGVTYHTHVQHYGWMDWVKNGALSGTQGESKRLEALEVKLGDETIPGGIQYRTHVQTYGWQRFVSNGAMSGTSGESKRLEAIEIALTGEVSNYFDVWYRTHVQTFGWLGWAKNGERSGTANQSKRMEALEIRLVPKGREAPGSTMNNFVASSNSPLVVYTHYSPNHSGPRNHPIDTITPHYMGGNGTVEGLGMVFAPVSRQASSNYGIGSDGRVGLYVDEANRAWTSGSSANDNRAITIECANLADGSLTNACWNSLVNLCVDLCQRNGKTRLVYRGRADYSGLGSEDMLLTMHKWFQATDCPGPWLSYQFDRLANEVNAKLQAG